MALLGFNFVRPSGLPPLERPFENAPASNSLPSRDPPRPPMRIWLCLLLVVCGSVLRAEPGGVSFTEARQKGREKSRYLKEAAKTDTASAAAPTADVEHFRKTIAPLLAQKCVACHGPDSATANLRIDKLDPDLLSGADVDRWQGIYKVLSNSEMPPEDEPEYRLTDAERGNVVDWLSRELSKASIARHNRGEQSSFRRMTKYEYNYALQDLLGLAYPIAHSLPPETVSEDGFQNRSDLLQMSALQFEAYRELGLKALRRVTVRGERPTPVTYILSMKELMEKAPDEKPKKPRKADRNGPHLVNPESGDEIPFADVTVRPKDATASANPDVSPVVLMLPRSKELKINLDRFLPDEGTMRVRIRAGRTTMEAEDYLGLRLIFSAHTSNNANFSQVISPRDLPVTASAEKPEFIEFDIPLSEIQRNPFRKLETTFPRRDEFLHLRCEGGGRGGKEAARIAIDYVEISAPHYEAWPPATHLAIFPPSAERSDEQRYGRDVLTRFLERAWRRPVTAEDVTPFMNLFAKYRPDFETFEEAMLEVLATALASPEFLYLTQRSPTADAPMKTIGDSELATRLAFFLWASVPDEELLDLARKGELKNPAVLKAQVERLLADPKAERFAQHFVEQWLGLEGLATAVHVKDDALREAMRQEPVAFFLDAVRSNRSALDFVQSDDVVINERLARHYGLPEVYGPHFRRVPVTDQTHRGGILTAAGLLAMNSDGEHSHPLKRGVWLLERILHDPPPPPPADVPKVDLTDPRILEMTLKERLADHRNKAACNSCHSRIDPWGIAFENYDALGNWRTKDKNKPVDATATLFNKQELTGADGLKRYLLAERQDQFSRALVHKLTAYALGRSLSFADHAEIDALTVAFRKQDDRLADLIQLVVSSKLFHAP